jgi:hypothetical protein
MQIEPNDHVAQEEPREREANSEGTGRGDYVVGHGRPPLHTQWRPGQSGNPIGRRKERRNVKTELKEIISKPITIRDGEAKRKLSLAAANVLAHGVKGAKGDVRSASLFLNHARSMGLLENENDQGINSATGNNPPVGAFLPGPANNPRPSETLFENLDLGLLSREEQIELSRLAEVIDLGGDVTALSTADFARVKHIVNKGRGRDVTHRDIRPSETP